MSKHTPGPWRALRDEVYTSKSRRVCPRVAAGESLPLGVDFERAMANARLIAAAPTMYEYIASSASNGCAEASEIIAAINASKAGGKQ